MSFNQFELDVERYVEMLRGSEGVAPDYDAAVEGMEALMVPHLELVSAAIISRESESGQFILARERFYVTLGHLLKQMLPFLVMSEYHKRKQSGSVLTAPSKQMLALRSALLDFILNALFPTTCASSLLETVAIREEADEQQDDEERDREVSETQTQHNPFLSLLFHAVLSCPDRADWRRSCGDLISVISMRGVEHKHEAFVQEVVRFLLLTSSRCERAAVRSICTETLGSLFAQKDLVSFLPAPLLVEVFDALIKRSTCDPGSMVKCVALKSLGRFEFGTMASVIPRDMPLIARVVTESVLFNLKDSSSFVRKAALGLIEALLPWDAVAVVKSSLEQLSALRFDPSLVVRKTVVSLVGSIVSHLYDRSKVSAELKDSTESTASGTQNEQTSNSTNSSGSNHSLTPDTLSVLRGARECWASVILAACTDPEDSVRVLASQTLFDSLGLLSGSDIANERSKHGPASMALSSVLMASDSRMTAYAASVRAWVELQIKARDTDSVRIVAQNILKNLDSATVLSNKHPNDSSLLSQLEVFVTVQIVAMDGLLMGESMVTTALKRKCLESSSVVASAVFDRSKLSFVETLLSKSFLRIAAVLGTEIDWCRSMKTRLEKGMKTATLSPDIVHELVVCYISVSGRVIVTENVADDSPAKKRTSGGMRITPRGGNSSSLQAQGDSASTSVIDLFRLACGYAIHLSASLDGHESQFIWFAMLAGELACYLLDTAIPEGLVKCLESVLRTTTSSGDSAVEDSTITSTSARLRCGALHTLGKLWISEERLGARGFGIVSETILEHKAALFRLLADEQANSPSGTRRRDSSTPEATSLSALLCTAFVVLGDLCATHPGLAESYVGHLSVSAADERLPAVVRGQALFALGNLLKEDFIKFRGPCVRRFAMCLSDPDSELALASRGMYSRILAKRPIAAVIVVLPEAICGMCGVYEFPGLKLLRDSIRNQRDVSLKHDPARRRETYSFFTSGMDNSVARLQLIMTLVSKFLSPIIDEEIPMPIETDAGEFQIVSDVLHLISSSELRVSRGGSRGGAESARMEGGETAAEALQAAVASSSGEANSQEEGTASSGEAMAAGVAAFVERKVIAEKLVPVLVSLRHMAEEAHTSLLGPISDCLVAMLEPYKDSLDQLVGDPQLVSELLFEMQKRQGDSQMDDFSGSARNTPYKTPNRSHGAEDDTEAAVPGNTSRVLSPAGRLHSPGGRLHSPGGRSHSPGGRLHSPAVPKEDAYIHSMELELTARHAVAKLRTSLGGTDSGRRLSDSGRRLSDSGSGSRRFSNSQPQHHSQEYSGS